MVTDPPPRNRGLARFLASDQMTLLPVPPDGRLPRIAAAIAAAMGYEATGDVRRACDQFLEAASDFYRVPRCTVKVLRARPLRVRERSAVELFGDYTPDTMLIRVWMRTAVRKEVTSFGTFLSTLCHEFCHHLDIHKLGFRETWHTRGFYARTAALYHHARGTPLRPLVWAPLPRQRWRIDWQRTRG
jgi:hypothetical protein